MNNIVQADLVSGQPGWLGKAAPLSHQLYLTDAAHQTGVLLVCWRHLAQSWVGLLLVLVSPNYFHVNAKWIGTPATQFKGWSWTCFVNQIMLIRHRYTVWTQNVSSLIQKSSTPLEIFQSASLNHLKLIESLIYIFFSIVDVSPNADRTVVIGLTDYIQELLMRN